MDGVLIRCLARSDDVSLLFMKVCSFESTRSLGKARKPPINKQDEFPEDLLHS